MENKKSVLVLGGSKFVGLRLVERLLEQQEYRLTIVNRGKKHWNSRFQSLIEGKEVEYLVSDRDANNYCEALKSRNFDVVIDFCCYLVDDLFKIISFLGEIKLYLLVSTDSVYNLPFTETNTPIREEQAVLPSKLSEQYDKALVLEEYGLQKLECERYLVDSKVPFLVLRLSDVVGEFDESFRVWYYLEFIKRGVKIKVRSEDFNSVLSFTAATDVVKAILKAIKGEIEPNQIFNLACEENTSLTDFIRNIACFAGRECEFEVDESVIGYLPSVDIGPVCTEKAKKCFKISKNIERELEKSVSFFLEADKYAKEREKMERDLNI